jgi:hypothetical protein
LVHTPPLMVEAIRQRDELAILLRECLDNCHMQESRRDRVEAALAKVGAS